MIFLIPLGKIAIIIDCSVILICIALIVYSIYKDKKRKSYHNYYCQGKWGDSRNYDFSINSSKLGIDTTVDVLEDYIKRRIEKM